MPSLSQMKQILHESMKAGAFGFSFNKNMEDRPEDGSFLPSHVASEEEFRALAQVMSEFGVGHIGLTLGLGLTLEQRKAIRTLSADMARISGRPFHLLDTQIEEDLGWVESCRAEGIPMVLQQLSTSVPLEFKLSEFNLFDYMPNWVQPLVGSAEERAGKLRQPSVRTAMKQDVIDWPNFRTDFERMRVLEAAFQRNEQYEGVTINQLAEMTGKEPLDAMLDLALDEGLETEFVLPPRDTEEEIKAKRSLLVDPYSHVSVSDGGAHTRFNTNSFWPVFFLTYWIRDREIMTLEQAHYKMSALPAWLTDFKDRGTLRVGNWADIIVYNMSELGYVYDNLIFATDFPGGEKRLIQKPTGLNYTLVNGTVTFEGNNCTGALPGKLLRSYDMVD